MSHKLLDCRDGQSVCAAIVTYRLHRIGRVLDFKILLETAGLDPKQVLLLRHQDDKPPAKALYRLWLEDPAAFEDFQCRQALKRVGDFKRPIWASFLPAPQNETVFVGLYAVSGFFVCDADWIAPHSGKVAPAGTDAVFAATRLDALSTYAGRLFIGFSKGRSWKRLTENGAWPVLEIRREIREPDFPGYLNLIVQLSEIESLPANWTSALRVARGVYLLTCPRTNEQYVGAAYGADGFLGRWLEYARTGHGGNVALKSRDPSNYRVSILATVGSDASADDVLAMEALWKRKLQSREMGLNAN